MGAVAGALGIGGALGQLAGGVSIGGESSNASTTTEYSQRIISIPPMSSKSLEPMFAVSSDNKFKNIEIKEYTSKKKDDYIIIPQISIMNMKAGDVVFWNEKNSPLNFSFHLSYAFDEILSKTNSITTRLYVGEMWGIARNNDNGTPVLKYYKNLDKALYIGLYNSFSEYGTMNIEDLDYKRHLKK